MAEASTLLAGLVLLVVIVAAAALTGGHHRHPPRAHFRPIPISTCGSPFDEHYAVDLTSRNAPGTVVWDPYSTQSRVSLERGVEAPGVAEALNPYSGLGKTSSLRAMSDRYRGDAALQSLSIYELQPGEPGYMEPVGDGAMSLLSSVARRSSFVPPAPACLLAGADTAPEFYTDGRYGAAVLQDPLAPQGGAGLRESLTSRPRPLPNTLTASKVGLGSIRQDPRFEPGPACRVPGGDASWAPGDYAGGVTLGGFGAYRFLPGGAWDGRYVDGFTSPTAMVTGRLW
jgi:hypothetical protein